MAVPDDSAMARQLEAEGYFEVARRGDQKAASLFARLCATRLNPQANPNGWGWLRKGGGTNVDGYAEDAIVFGNGANTPDNVADTVTGAGAPGASVASRWDAKPRRIGVDTWEAPRALTAAELAYLKGGTVPQPQPTGVPYKPYPTDESTFDAVGAQIEADYKRAGRPGLDAASVRWTARIMHDYEMGEAPPPSGRILTLEQSIAKHRGEWCAVLGIPVV